MTLSLFRPAALLGRSRLAGASSLCSLCSSFPAPILIPTFARFFSNSTKLTDANGFASKGRPISHRATRASTRALDILAMQKRLEEAKARFRELTEEEREAMKKYYTSQQIEAIEAAEKMVDVEDLSLQGSLRTDSWRLDYLDDFTRLRPVIDVEAPVDEHDTAKAVAPAIPSLPSSSYGHLVNDSTVDHTKLHTQRIGLSDKTISDLYIKDVNSHRVMNQTKLGKIQSIYYIAIAGNQKGWIGYGEGKASSAAEARKQAQRRAIRNMAPVALYESRTIYGQVEAKVSGTTVKLFARPPGFGLRCQHIIFEICRAAGISDISARVGRNRNKMNTVKAAVAALQSQRIPEEIAIGRGRKLVDLRKVYYDGNVL